MAFPSALLVSNSSAGSTTRSQVADVADVLRQGFDVTAVSSSGPDDLRAALDAFDGERVIVAGGDGSLHLLLNLLSTTGRLSRTTVGLIPMGTGNDFASGIGLPDDPVAAARVCLRDAPTPMDLLVADDGEVVANAAHAGLGAVASERAQSAKPVVGPLAYPLAAVFAGASERGYDLEVTLDGDVVHDGAALLVLAANGPCLGGGARLCAGADVTDGVLDIMLIGDVSVPDRAGLALRIQRGTHLDHGGVQQWQGTQLRIRGDAVDHSRDGELRYGLTDVTYTIDAAAWSLLR